MPLTFTDTHCHLDFDRFKHDRADVIANAQKAGICWILNPGIDLPTSRFAIQLAQQYPGFIAAAVGFHPNIGKPLNNADYAALLELAQNPDVKAIGEIGLDYYREHTPKAQQMLMFETQLAIAQKTNLPVLIHCRDADDDTLAVLRTWQRALPENHRLKTMPGVMHSFSGDMKLAEAVMALGFYIGVSGPVTFGSAQLRKAVTAQIPLTSIFLETDAPFLTPHPHRGQRNEPAYIPFIASEIARLQHVSVDEVAHTTWQNAKKCFNL